MEFVLLPVLPADYLKSIILERQSIKGSYQPNECYFGAKPAYINHFWGDVFL